MRVLPFEQLLSRRVRAPSGGTAGRLEEVRVSEQSDYLCVVEYHLGPDALLERLAVGLNRFPLVRVLGLGKQRHGRRVPWDKLDLSDPHRPRLTCPVSELEPLAGD